MSVRYALLALLSEGSKYGLQLREEFEVGTGEVWPLNAGQVYATLQRLERDGLVESDDRLVDGPQKGYRLTDEGGSALRAWLKASSGSSPPPRDDLVIKVLIALRVPGVDVVELVQEHRRVLVEAMHHFTMVKAQADPTDLGILVIADAEVYRIDAVIRWLDSTEARLRQGLTLKIPDVPASPIVRRRRHRVDAS